MLKKTLVVSIFAVILCLSATASVFDGVFYSPLDDLGRAGPALAVLSPDTLGSRRENISQFTPSGYEYIPANIPGGCLWNRCHLIGAQLAEDTEVLENLVTGTRKMNLDMLTAENAVADYIRETGDSVLYKVVPDFRRDELICHGVTIYAKSLDGDYSFAVYCANAQAGYPINYNAGAILPDEPDVEGDYVLNIKSMRFHLPDCQGVKDMSEKNRQEYHGSRAALIEQGYKACGTCKP